MGVALSPQLTASSPIISLVYSPWGVCPGSLVSNSTSGPPWAPPAVHTGFRSPLGDLLQEPSDLNAAPLLGLIVSLPHNQLLEALKGVVPTVPTSAADQSSHSRPEWTFRTVLAWLSVQS